MIGFRRSTAMARFVAMNAFEAPFFASALLPKAGVAIDS
jgi:hypothetical protein